MKIEQALHKVGDANKFQVFTIAYMCLKWLVVAYIILAPSYLFLNPTFTCGSETRVSEENACGRIDQCFIDNKQTLTYQLGLYCDNRFLRDSILSSEYIGSIIGLIIMSILADRLGRKLIIVLTLFFSAIGAVTLGFAGTYNILELTYAGIVLMGFGGYALSIVSFIYLGEVNSDSWRQISIIMTFSFWALAEMLFYPILTYFPSWKVVLMACIILPLVVLIIFSYLLVETPAYLYQSSKAACVQSLNYIARFNGKPGIQVNDLEDRTVKPEDEIKIQDTILKPKFLLPLVILSVGQICNNAMYYITQFSVNHIGNSFQMNMLIIGALEFVAYIITNIYCQKMKRKRWIMFMMLVSGAIGVLFQFVMRNNTDAWNAERYVETVMIAISRLANTFGFALFSLITTESFPTSIKTTGTGVAEALSNLGNMASPFIVTIADKLGVQSLFVGGVLCLVGFGLMTLSTETLVIDDKNSQEKSSLLTESTLQTNNNQSEVQNRP